MLEALQAMGSVVLDLHLLLLIFATTIIGVVIGVLPGLGATTGAALLLPFTLTMDPVHAITVLATIYVSATFAGSITAILINTPGTSAAAATTFDGFPLAQRGEAGRALGVAVVSSTVGGVFSVIVLCIAAPMLARVAYQFRPPEYFALTLFGLSMLASISSGGAVKNLIGGVFGVWLATIGAERATGIERFLFGNYELYEGLSFVPVFIGLFAMSELLVQSKRGNRIANAIGMNAVKLPSKEDYKKIWKTILRSCGIGTFIGILPAEGATVASMIGYSEARRWSKNKEEFGKGAIEGIAGAEAANNAATGGAMVPTMVLGIPGSGTTAIILVGLMVHGLRPGPYLFTEQVDKVYQIFGAMLVANLMFLGMGLYAAKFFARISLIPSAILWPIVFALSIVGSYSLSSSLLDVWIVLIFGVIGFFARRHGFAVAPIAVGLILGEMVESNLQNSLKMFEGKWWLIFTQPLAVLFLLLAFLGLCGPAIYGWLTRKKAS
ncbi:MAG TPA: C4-dicarboxylate ABC transporter permease [Deltaproteobacteria bacterium]|jgi:putative tricarboxylic transport membrane protein|nr:C4-dicarboxylate ABC transporter permease [Candidatus Lambdaproteobacteria bacterium]HIL15138.1 C4-dicarboxylate ABC transporter permease [Deltaproteobacteria bacterium]